MVGQGGARGTLAAAWRDLRRIASRPSRLETDDVLLPTVALAGFCATRHPRPGRPRGAVFREARREVTESEACLVARAARGAEDAFRLLVERYQRPVFNLILRMVRSAPDAEDLSQETFLKAFRKLGSFDPTYRFSSWLLKIASNTAIDFLRRRRPAHDPLDESSGAPGAQADVPGPWPAGGPDPEVEAARGEIALALEAALGRLRPDYRRVLVLRYHEDLSMEEIASVTGLPVGTVKSHLHRGRAEMALLLTQAGWRRTGSDRSAGPPATRSGTRP